MRLKGTGIKRETESLIPAAQEQAIRNNVIKAKIDNKQKESKFRMCGNEDETLNHIVTKCSMLAQKKYKRRQDSVRRRICSISLLPYDSFLFVTIHNHSFSQFVFLP